MQGRGGGSLEVLNENVGSKVRGCQGSVWAEAGLRPAGGGGVLVGSAAFWLFRGGKDQRCHTSCCHQDYFYQFVPITMTTMMRMTKMRVISTGKSQRQKKLQRNFRQCETSPNKTCFKPLHHSSHISQVCVRACVCVSHLLCHSYLFYSFFFLSQTILT